MTGILRGTGGQKIPNFPNQYDKPKRCSEAMLSTANSASSEIQRQFMPTAISIRKLLPSVPGGLRLRLQLRLLPAGGSSSLGPGAAGSWSTCCLEGGEEKITPNHRAQENQRAMDGVCCHGCARRAVGAPPRLRPDTAGPGDAAAAGSGTCSVRAAGSASA